MTSQPEAALTEAQAAYEAAKADYAMRLSALDEPPLTTDMFAWYIARIADTGVHLIALQAERIASLEAEVAAAVGRLDEVRDECMVVLSFPDAWRGEYLLMEYRPYDEILSIVDPPPQDPATEGALEAYFEYTRNWREGMPMMGYREWKADWKRDHAAQAPADDESGVMA